MISNTVLLNFSLCCNGISCVAIAFLIRRLSDKINCLEEMMLIQANLIAKGMPND